MITEPEEGLRILARIIAKAYLVDNQGSNATMARNRKGVKKNESLPGAMRSNSHGKRSYQSKG
jgi:hypothetical protein